MDRVSNCPFSTRLFGQNTRLIFHLNVEKYPTKARVVNVRGSLGENISSVGIHLMPLCGDIWNFDIFE